MRVCARACERECECVCVAGVGEGSAWSPTSAQESHAGFPLPARKESGVRANNDAGKPREPGADAGAPAVGGGSGEARWRGCYRVELVGDIQTLVILTGGCHCCGVGLGRGGGADRWEQNLLLAPSDWKATWW